MPVTVTAADVYKRQKYTRLEAKVLDLALVLHMEHGGGNNSSFTTHVVTSSGTDTYSAISAALGSLKAVSYTHLDVNTAQVSQSKPYLARS